MSRPVVLLLALALALRVGLALAFPNVAWPDETFETREPAHRLAFGNGVVTWEYREGIRSWVLPFGLAGVMKATAWMAPGSTGYVVGIAVVLSLISLLAVWLAYAYGRRVLSPEAGLFAAAGSVASYDLIYFGPKALNEVVAAHALLPALFFISFGKTWRAFALAGAACAISVGLRIQLAPAVVVAACFLIGRGWRARVLPFAAAFVPVFVAFGLVDAYTWSYPFSSFVDNVRIQAVEGRSAEYGVSPWYAYLVWLGGRLGPLLIFAVAGVRHAPLLGAVALAMLISHSLIPHKEYRFIYPMAPLVVALAAFGVCDLAGRMARMRPLLKRSGLVVVAGLVVFGLQSVVPAMRRYDWQRDETGLRAMSALSVRNDVCGVMLYRKPWMGTGGYTYLHHDVPLYWLPNTVAEDDFASLTPAANYIVAGAPLAQQGSYSPYTVERCWSETCLYRRPGECAPAQGRSINEELERRGY